jgi:uncharacterized protein YegL
MYFRRLIGITDIEDSFKRLNKLIEEEVRMAIAQTLRVAIEHKSGAQPFRPVTHLTLDHYPHTDAKQANEAIVREIHKVTNNIDEIRCS